MSCLRVLVFSALVLLGSISYGQIDGITITAGSEEDKELTSIGNETDNQKKVSLYQAFLQKYSANPMAVAYGNWQLSQTYQATGDMQKAIDTGDKALAASPRNLDILT